MKLSLKKRRFPIEVSIIVGTIFNYCGILLSTFVVILTNLL